MQFSETFLFLGVLVVPLVSAVICQDSELDAVVVDVKPNGILELEETAKQGSPTKRLSFGGAHPHDLAARASMIDQVPELYGIRGNNGSNRPSYKIVGGRVANYGEFPYIVSILKPGEEEGELDHFCGGSLISNQWVLTAAHCLHDDDDKPFPETYMPSIVIYAGAHNVTKPREPHRQTFGVKRWRYHRNYNVVTELNDIALIQLDKPAKLGKYVQLVVVSLSNSDPAPGQDVQLSGWGTMVYRGPASDVLRTVTVPIIKNKKCQQKYTTVGGASGSPIRDTMMCTGVTNPKKDACQGDSGGPVVSFNGKVVQVGIVSWGVGCGDHPGVHTRVKPFLDWIHRLMKKWN